VDYWTARNCWAIPVHAGTSRVYVVADGLLSKYPILIINNGILEWERDRSDW